MKRYIWVLAMALVLGASAIPATASCVHNTSEYRIYAEYYGEREERPQYDRGGSWLNPGEKKCLDGQSGDWLLSAPDWISGKPPDWQQREKRNIGGPANQPRGYWLWAVAPRDGTIEVFHFRRYQEKTGYWLYCDYRVHGMFTYTLQITKADYARVFVNPRKSPVYSLNAGTSPLINLNQFFRRGENILDLWQHIPHIKVPGDTGYVLKRDGRVVFQRERRRGPGVEAHPQLPDQAQYPDGRSGRRAWLGTLRLLPGLRLRKGLAAA
ncbi:MAG: hypothetical protein ACRD2Q_02995 [Terriglobales bacterium]